MAYQVKYCKEINIGDSSRGVEWVEDPKDAEFFGVYKLDEESYTLEWIADFPELEQANEFVRQTQNASHKPR